MNYKIEISELYEKEGSIFPTEKKVYEQIKVLTDYQISLLILLINTPPNK